MGIAVVTSDPGEVLFDHFNERSVLSLNVHDAGNYVVLARVVFFNRDGDFARE
jgi:hypothetical protein